MPFRSIIVFACFLIGSVIPLSAQYWVQKAGGLTIDEALDIALDNEGNSYTVGYFTDNASFGTSNYTSQGSTDIFVFKTNNQGVIEWSAVAGGVGSDKGLSIAVDKNGNSYITGFFNNTISFDTISLISSGSQDAFIAKYDNSGVLQWVHKMGGNQADIGNGIAVDTSGNVAVTGEFKGTALFGSTSLTSNANSVDVFISKLTSNGAFSWTKHGTGAGTNRGIDICFDPAGNIYTTGHFSLSITFDVLHSNTSSNLNFLVKHNQAGAEQWFRIIGGSSFSNVNALASDSIGNLYLTGDFTGTVLFNGSPNVSLTGNYSNKSFVAKYTNLGQPLWATSLSSEGFLSSQAISAASDGSVFITGHFKCQLNDFSDIYGSGVFQVIGKHDIFISKYDSTGNWLLARHFASRKDDFSYGIDTKNPNQPHIAGSFQDTLNVPISADFIASNISSFSPIEFVNNNGYCNDAYYGKFRRLITTGNSDILSANFFDPNRSLYDFFDRSNSVNCDLSFIKACQFPGCPDTVASCSSFLDEIQFFHCQQIAPRYTSSWFGPATPNPTNPNLAGINSTGLITTMSYSVDACIYQYDTLYSIIHPTPNKPTISDNLGVNSNSLNTTTITTCNTNTVTLTASQICANCTFSWINYATNFTSLDTTITVPESGFYWVIVTDSNGCQEGNYVQVLLSDPLPPFNLLSNITDTMSFCGNEQVKFFLYDSIGNPSMQELCFNPLLPYPVILNIVNVTPSVLNSSAVQICGSTVYLYPDTLMYVTVELQIIRISGCGNDTIDFIDSFYIELLPYPIIPELGLQISGPNVLCPGDSAILVAQNGPYYSWSGNGVTGATTDSVIIYSSGAYTITTVLTDTNAFGCTTISYQSASKTIVEKNSPNLSSSSLLICPNSTVTLTIAPFATQVYNDSVYFWEGPSGAINSHGPNIQVSEAGQYFCMVMDSDSCGLVSNTVTLSQYIVPGLSVNGPPILCVGDSLEISVNTNQGSLVNWLPPFSGPSLSQTVYEAGIYQCSIFSCGIQSVVSIEIFNTHVASEIMVSGPLCDSQTVTLYGIDSMYSYQWYPTGDSTQNIVTDSNNEFVLITYDSAGCIAISDTIEVINHQVPTVIDYEGDSVICFGESLVLTGNEAMANYLWLPSGDTTASVTISQAGNYTLQTIDTLGCEGISIPITISIPDTFIYTEALDALRFCEGDSVVLLTSKTGYESYVWIPNFTQGKSIVVTQSGIYQLVATDEFGCQAFSSKYIVEVEQNIIDEPLGRDTTICQGDAILLEVSNNLGEIQWYDPVTLNLLGTGQTYKTDSLIENTTYLVWSNFSLCKSDSNFITVFVKDCKVPFAPNIFTPNGDGYNDIFKLNLEESTCFQGYIYNRWGLLVYEFDQINQGWDGSMIYSGEQVPEGTYYYLLEYCDHYGDAASLMGTVTLIRE